MAGTCVAVCVCKLPRTAKAASELSIGQSGAASSPVCLHDRNVDSFYEKPNQSLNTLPRSVRDQLCKPLLQLLLRLWFDVVDIAVPSCGCCAAMEVRASLRASRPRAWHQLAMEKITPAGKRRECFEFQCCSVVGAGVLVGKVCFYVCSSHRQVVRVMVLIGFHSSPLLRLSAC